TRWPVQPAGLGRPADRKLSDEMIQPERPEGDGWITGFEVVPYALRFMEPYVTARGTLRQREMVLLRVHTKDGLGLGEAIPLSLRGGHSLDHIAQELRELRDEFSEASES